MPDYLTTDERSRLMAKVKSKDTKPEKIVRTLVHALGYRYRLHRHDLPGKPDLVFSSRRKIIFVHGCFWHRHTCRRGCSTPQTRHDWWVNKFKRTVERDRKNIRRLRAAGWGVMVIWECQTAPAKLNKLVERIRRFLD